jgi:HK97 gp10 family phage protein
MSNDAIEFNGLENVLKKLDMPLNPQKMQAALTRACLLVVRNAAQKAQVGRGTGDLARSITFEATPEYGRVYTPLFYAPYVEYGTGIYAEEGGRQDVPWCYYDEKTNEFIYTCGQHPMPFMRPALDENREEIKRILKEGITNG